MTDQDRARREIEVLLDTMLAADGYQGVIRRWPANGAGHAGVEIVASPQACSDCLVPKGILKLVLADCLPEGIEIDEADIRYPSDPGA